MNNNKKEYIKKDVHVETFNKKYEIVEDNIKWDVKLHFHDYLEVELILDGTATQYLNDYKTHLKRGTLTVLRPNVDCHSIETDNINVIKFYVKPFMIDSELWKEISLLLDPLFIELDGREFDHVIELFKAIEYEQYQKGKYTDDIVKSIINSILYLFVEKKDSNDNNVTVRKNLISYLLDNDRYLTDVSLQDFATDFGYSISHASKYFKENTGMTFSEAKQYYRIQSAKRLLLSSNYSISDIATMCGFNYYHLFHNLFKKNTGMTPLEFKKNNK